MIDTKINGRWNLMLPEHRAARPEWQTGWEVERLDSMNANIRRGDIVYDIGAEEGDISALIASWVWPNGGVCLFEPNPKVWPNIKAIWDANNLRHPLATWVGFASDATSDAALLDDAGLLLLAHDPESGWPRCATELPVIGDHGFRHLAQETDVTPQITLTDFVRQTNIIPDVITMDVEGSELRVLRGARVLLHGMKPLVYLSMHPEFMDELYGDTPTDLLHFMADVGYVGMCLAVDHEEHWVFWHQLGRKPK